MRWAQASALAGVAAALVAAGPALAQGQIGTAAAVVPQVTGAPPQQEARVLQVGLDMFQNERVQTGERGRTQLLFLDGTALTVGPNSDIVLDEYVFDPTAGTGSIALSATRGVFRVVGGRISKSNPVTIRTPTVTVGVRGGVAFLNVGPTVSAAFIYGDRMSVTGGGRTETATRPGTQIVTPPDGIPNPPQPLSEDAIADSLDATEGETGAPPAGPSVGDEDVAETQLAELGSGTEPPATPDGAVVPPLDAAAVEQTADQTTASQIAQIEQSTDSDIGGGGGGSPTFGNLVGRYKTTAVSGVDDGTGDDSPAFNIPFTGGGIVNGQFTASVGSSSFGLDLLTFPVVPDSGGMFTFGPSDTTDTPFGPITGSGWISDAGDFGFIEYLEDDFPGFRGIAFFGMPTPASAFTSGLRAYSLRDDFVLGGSKVPFFPASLNGDIGPGGVAYVDLRPSGQRSTLLGGRVVVSGQGANQRWAASVLVGEILTDAAGRPFVDGEMRGATRLTPSSSLTTFLNGSLSSSDAGDGSDFFGSKADFVLEASLVDANDAPTGAFGDLGVDIFEDGAQLTTIYPNAISRRLNDPQPMSRTSRTMFFETAGISQDDDGSTIQSRRFATNLGSPGMIVLDAANGTVSASASLVSLENGFSSPTVLNFGEPTGNRGESAFLTDRIWGATESSQGSAVGGVSAIFQGAIVSSALVVLDGVLPPGVLCACQFVDWGFWGGEAVVGSIRHEFALIPFAAAAPVGAAQFAGSGTAVYNGHAIANFFDGVNNFIAGGAMSLTASYGSGMVSVVGMDITNLNGNNLTFVTSGPPASAPGPVLLTLQSATGPANFLLGEGQVRFAGPGAPPEEVYGHFAAQDMVGINRVAGIVAGRQ